MELRHAIEQTIRTINEIENSAADPQARSDALDALITLTCAGSLNGAPRGDRAEEKQLELELFGSMPDYHREIHDVIIDGHRAAFAWRMTGTAPEVGPIAYRGVTIADFDDEARIASFSITAGPEG